MEGVSQEANPSGHLGSRYLVVLWDDNGISIDGQLMVGLLKMFRCAMKRLAGRLYVMWMDMITNNEVALLLQLTPPSQF